MTETTSEVTSRPTSRTTTRSGDTIAELLADRRRRYLLHALRDASDELTFAELARKIAAWETEQSVADVSDATVERVHLSLYHNHVLRFADAGLVEYDADADVVALTADGAATRTFLESGELRVR